MKEPNHLFYYGNDFQPGKPFLKVPAGNIFQIAELSIIKASEILGHTQECDEITYIISGKGKMYSDESCFDVRAGQIHFTTRGIYHKLVADENNNIHCCSFGYMANNQDPEMKCYLEEVRKMKHFLIYDDGNMKSLFQLLMNEYYNYSEGSDKMLQHYFCQIITILCRIALGQGTNKPGRTTASAADSIVYRIMKYIDKQPWNISSVKQIAEDLSYSEYHLSHVFKQKMGVTIKEYLMQRKILAATELLKNTSMGIEEISEHMNFSSARTFRQVFKRYMGMNASEYRKNM